MLSAVSIRKFISDFNQTKHIAPLIYFRIVFGLVMFVSILRFILKGWVYDLYIAPKFFFPYYGFEWVKPLEATGMYAVFAFMALAALGISFGFFYRISAFVFFFLFTYVELIDKSNYLNHYYFVSIVSFLMILVPANRYFSLDAWNNPAINTELVPGWCIKIFKLQLGIVYFFAGLAKINYDWLVEAMPLRIWLPANYDFPLIGFLFDEVWVAYLFSWAGCIYDLFIPFLLINQKTRTWSYMILLFFHIMTYALFQIGMFPFIMMGLTIIFFSEDFHKKFLSKLQSIFKIKQSDLVPAKVYTAPKILPYLLIAYFAVQILLPFRYLLYPGELFWTEQGYRFSWRVMLMEKAGISFFYIKDPKTGREAEVCNAQFLTKNQEKMMSTQPDMILQYAHYLEKEFKKQGIESPEVRVESFVTVNGSGSRPYIDKNVDLCKIKEGFTHKNWVLPVGAEIK